MRNLTDKDYAEFMRLVDSETRNGGLARGVIGALLVAAGGKVKLSPLQILDALEGNLMFSAERVGLDFELRAASRPRCEKCGRWERHE